MNIRDIVEDSELSRKTQSNALNRALKQAYAQFPSSKSDIEAFANWAMVRQANAEELIDRQAELNRRQDAVIKGLDVDNTDQEEHIQKLDRENDELEAELDRVEKRLAMRPDTKQSVEPTPKSQGKPKKPAKSVPPGALPVPTPFAASASEPAIKSTNSKAGARAFSAMVPQLDQPQQSLNFNAPLDYSKAQQQTLPGIEVPAITNDPSDNILPALPTPSDDQGPWKNLKQPSLFSKDNVTDIEPKYYSDVARKIASDPEQLAKAMKVSENKPQEDEKIGDRYDPDDFDSMVLRLKKLAGAGPLKTVWDPVRRVYRNVPVNQQPEKKK